MVFPNKTPDIWAKLEGYLHLYEWHVATKFSAQSAEVFNAGRVSSYKKGLSIKCSASEFLSILPVVVLFVAVCVKPSGLCSAECSAIEALGDLMEALMAFKRAGADAILTYAAPWASRKLIAKAAGQAPPAEGQPQQAAE